MSVEAPSVFISGDWGTSRLRLRLVEEPGLAVRAEVEAELGVASVFQDWKRAGEPADREAFFLNRLAPELERLDREAGGAASGAPLILSGMASSTIGIRELPYAAIPFDLGGPPPPIVRLPPGRLRSEIWLVSGLCSTDEILRGEETILIGLARQGLSAGLVILPGTHSKHVTIVGRAVARFRTYMTGELYSILSAHSVLSASVEASREPGPAYEQAVREAGQSGANPLGLLFGIRARAVLEGTSAPENGQRLSGLLIGSELQALATAEEDLGSETPIVVAASEPLATYYQRALEALGLGDRVRVFDGDATARALLAGQAAILETEGALP